MNAQEKMRFWLDYQAASDMLDEALYALVVGHKETACDLRDLAMERFQALGYGWSKVVERAARVQEGKDLLAAYVAASVAEGTYRFRKSGTVVDNDDNTGIEV
jgi:hypothetical protein